MPKGMGLPRRDPDERHSPSYRITKREGRASHTYVRYLSGMTGAELLRKLRRLARARSIRFEYEPRAGKGSHGQLLLGDHLTTIKDLKEEIGPGLLSDMLKQLGLTKKDLS
jgi:mRNA interferase HicA